MVIQILFEEAEADSLLIIDACDSANSGTINKHSGVTELVSSGGFKSTAPGAGHFPFTNALIRFLGHTKENNFSVPRLYSTLISRMRNSPNRMSHETPFHCTLTTDTND
jgi:hypothetical protein